MADLLTRKPARTLRSRDDSAGAGPAARARRIWDAFGVRAFLIIASLVFLFPLFWMISTALKSPADLAMSPPQLLPTVWTWENFAEVFNTIPFARFFLNSVFVAVVSVVVTVVANFLIAYGFSCFEWKHRDAWFVTVLVTLFLPFPLSIIPTFQLFSWLGWVNTYLPLIVPHMFGSAFFIFLLRQFLLQVPRDYMNAARLDGASEWRIVWGIVFPLARPAVITVAILAGTRSWDEFLNPLLYLQSESIQTLPIGLQRFNSDVGIQFDLLMAASVMVIVPPVLLFFFGQRYFLRGITLGAAK